MIQNCPSFQGYTLSVEPLDPLKPRGHQPQAELKDHPLERFGRFQQRLSYIKTVLDQLRPEDTWLGIEHYAMHAMHSSSVSTLCELGGLLRYMLFQMGFWVHEVSITSIKKYFTGKGNANKEQMHETFVHQLGLPDLSELVGRPKGPKGVQHPIEDMVDALAVACFASSL